MLRLSLTDHFVIVAEVQLEEARTTGLGRVAGRATPDRVVLAPDRASVIMGRSNSLDRGAGSSREDVGETDLTSDPTESGE